MTTALQPEMLKRLAKICGRLGSDFDGERAAAGLLATRLIRDAGLTWDGLFTQLKASSARTEQQNRAQSQQQWRHPEEPPRHGGAREMIAWALKQERLLTAWEREFLSDIQRRFKPLTDKQRAVLVNIVNRLESRLRARSEWR